MTFFLQQEKKNILSEAEQQDEKLSMIARAKHLAGVELRAKRSELK